MSLGGGSGIIFCTHRAPYCAPNTQCVVDTQMQTMKVFKLVNKIFYLTTIITIKMVSGEVAKLGNNINFDSSSISRNILLIQWVGYTTYLTPSMVKQYPQISVKISSPIILRDTLKADALDPFDKWIIEQGQMVSDHGAGSAEARAMKNLLKKEKSQLVMCETGD